MSSRTASIRPRNCACCSGDMEFHTAWAAAMRSASCSNSSSRLSGLPGNMSPYCSMNCSKLGLSSSPRLALLEHLVEGVVGVAHARHLLGGHRRQRVGCALEEGVGHLPAQLLDQFLERCTRLGGDEVVVLERLDATRHVAGLEVQGHAALGGHVAGHLGPPLVPRGAGLLLELVDGGTLVGLNLVELGRQIRPVGRPGRPRPASRPGGGAAASSRSRSPGICSPSARTHTRAQESSQCVVEIAPGQQVVRQAGQQVVEDRGRGIPGCRPTRSSRNGRSPGGLLTPPVQGACARGVLVQPLGQVQALEQELEGTCHEGG